MASVVEETSRWKSATSANSEPGGGDRPARTPGCCATLCKEWNPCQPWYLVSDTVTGRKLDVQHTFGPVGRWALLLKLLCTGFVLSTLVYSLVDTPNLRFWFAYYTNWALIFASFYQFFSFWNSLFSERITQPPERVAGVIKLTWVLFTIASNAGLTAAVIYWALVYDPSTGSELDYLNIASHGGVALVVVLDGLVMNRIPVRWMHFWVWVLLYNLLYLGWTVIHSELVWGIGNPNQSDNNPETNDDAIYVPLAWQEDWQSALIYSVVVVFGVSPIIYTILWALSLYSICCCCTDRRRYVDSHLDKIRNSTLSSKKKSNKSGGDVETPRSDGDLGDDDDDGEIEMMEEVSIFANTNTPVKQ